MRYFEETERRSGKSVAHSGDIRDPYQRDEARVIHSASFRRLQTKTQILGVGESDLYRTRLPHSLEVAQIGVGIVYHLRQARFKHESFAPYLPSVSLIRAICLAHDIGHPPFGHGGEIALNYMMRNGGGFEGNAQTLRVVTKLAKYTDGYGMDLTRRSLLGLLKYPVAYSSVRSTSQRREKSKNESENLRRVRAKDWKPPKCYLDEDQEIIDWILKPLSSSDSELFAEFCPGGQDGHSKSRYKSFDASIMDLADDIAYGIHDLEDAISLNLITKKMWKNHMKNKGITKLKSEWIANNWKRISKDLFSEKSHLRKKAIGAMVNWLVTSVHVIGQGGFVEPLLKYKAVLPGPEEMALKIIKSLVTDKVIKSPRVQQLEYKGQLMIMKIFQSFESDPERLLPDGGARSKLKGVSPSNCDRRGRIICDYIAGMTDEYAVRMYGRMFAPGHGSIFQPL